jgi:hypothetical protein
LIDGTTGTIYGTIDNSLGASFSGTVDFNGATVTNLSLSTLESDLIGNVVGNVDGDLIGSVFGDDSTAIIDGINKTATLTELDVDDININGNTITATGSAPQGIVLNVSGFGALQTNSDSLVMASRTITDPLGVSGDIDNIISQDDNYLYKSTAAYDGSTLIWKRAKLRDFTESETTYDTETISGAGASNAISTTAPISFIDTSGGTASLTLANGSAGQLKILTMTVAGSDATLTQANGNLDSTAVPTSIVFNAVGESVTLVSTGSAWIPISSLGATIS